MRLDDDMPPGGTAGPTPHVDGDPRFARGSIPTPVREDHTEKIRRPTPTRRDRIRRVVLAAAIAAAVTAIVITVVDAARGEPAAVPATAATAAESIGAAIDAGANATLIRAQAIASTSMLRAAIETDAATVADMASSDFVFPVAAGEVLEVIQVRAGVPVVLLRLPATAPAIAPLAGSYRLESDRDGIAVVASAPIAGARAGIGGTIVLRVPVELGPIRQRIGAHTTRATVSGLADPVVVAGSATATGRREVAIAIAPSVAVPDHGLALVVEVAAARSLAVLRNVAWGLTAALALLYLATWRRRASA